MTHDIVVPARPGQCAVRVRSSPWKSLSSRRFHSHPIGRVVEVLGDHMAPGMEIDVAIRSPQSTVELAASGASGNRQAVRKSPRHPSRTAGFAQDTAGDHRRRGLARFRRRCVLRTQSQRLASVGGDCRCLALCRAGHGAGYRGVAAAAPPCIFPSASSRCCRRFFPTACVRSIHRSTACAWSAR